MNDNLLNVCYDVASILTLAVEIIENSVNLKKPLSQKAHVGLACLLYNAFSLLDNELPPKKGEL